MTNLSLFVSTALFFLDFFSDFFSPEFSSDFFSKFSSFLGKVFFTRKSLKMKMPKIS